MDLVWLKVLRNSCTDPYLFHLVVGRLWLVVGGGGPDGPLVPGALPAAAELRHAGIPTR